jgi:hypothetical protein
MDGPNRKRRWGKRVALLVLAYTAFFLAFGARRPDPPGALGAMAAELRVGMPGDEAAAVLRAHYRADDLTAISLRGQTPDGAEFDGWGTTALDALPPAGHIAWAEMIVDDDRGRNLFVTLGPGGRVTALRLDSDSVMEEVRYWLARGTGWSGWRSVFRDHHACTESLARNFLSAE